MNCEVRVVGRPEVAAGFLLAGVPVLEAPTAAAAADAIRGLLERPSIGVVLLEAGFHEGLPDELRRRLAKRPLPMVVPFPEPMWEERPEAAESYIVELLRQVIGYRVRLR